MNKENEKTQTDELNKEAADRSGKKLPDLQTVLETSADHLVLGNPGPDSVEEPLIDEEDDVLPQDRNQNKKDRVGVGFRAGTLYDDILNGEDEEETSASAFQYRREERTAEEKEADRAERAAAFWEFIDRRKRQLRWTAIGIIVLAGAFATGIIIRNWTYDSYKVLVSSGQEDTISFSYRNINGRILKYSVDSAMLVDHNNTLLWNISYSMNSPKVTCCGDTFAIYDSNGTSAVICDKSGRTGSISAAMPIIKAKISRQGVFAAILQSGDNLSVQCFEKDGSTIATLKTTFTTPGYPVDIGLAEDGSLLAVACLRMENGIPISGVYFYNFGTVGQTQMDNQVSSFEYQNIITPEVDYMDTDTCVAFREDGFVLYQGSQIPDTYKEIKTDKTILSTFHDTEHIGMILQNDTEDHAYELCVYDKDGKLILDFETDFPFEKAELNENQVVLSNKSQFCVYSLEGVEKFNGNFETQAGDFLGFGQNKFIYVTEDSFNVIQLS